MAKATSRRTTVEVPIDAALLDHARHAGVDLRRALKVGIERAAGPVDAEEQRRLWLEENREAIDSHNRWVEEHGLPLSRYRRYPWPDSTSS